VPAIFDAPLAAHHQLIGRWAAARDATDGLYTRHEARGRIEQLFETAVMEILNPLEIAMLRVVVLNGEDDLPPAFAVICDTVGELELGWIAKTNVLANSLYGPVAPAGWRAAAYNALEGTLGIVLPIFGFHEFFEEISMYYWDGASEDEDARTTLIEYHGHDPDDLDAMILPSGIRARRPDWMTAKAAPLKQMPKILRTKLQALRDAYKAVKDQAPDRGAWNFDTDQIHSYVPGFEDCSTLPPMTLVPADEFAAELDEIGRHGMEYGFMDIAGLCPVDDAGKVEAWFTSLRLGVDFLLAAQDLIKLDPAKFRGA
jgi:hypothetical protein